MTSKLQRYQYVQNKLGGVFEALLDPTKLLFIALGLVPFAILCVYMRIHVQNVVWGDETGALKMMTAIKSGTFQFAYLFERQFIHHMYFNRTKTALLIWLAGYNLTLGAIISLILACLSLGILILLIRRTEQQAWVFIFPAVSLLMFSVHQDINWLMSWHGFWFFEIFFILTALFFLVQYAGQWRGIALAALFAFCATFEAASGLFLWPLIGIILWPLGYTQKKYLAFWGVASVVAIGLWWLTTHQFIGQNPTHNMTSLASLIVWVRFTLIWLGAYFVSRLQVLPYIDPFNLSTAVALAGLLLTALNVVYLWVVVKDRKVALVWLVLMVISAGTGAMIGLDYLQLDAGGSLHDVFNNRPFISWYGTIQNLFWIPCVVIAAIAIRRITLESQTAKRQWGRAILQTANVFVLIGLLGLFILQNQRIEASSYAGSVRDDQISGTPQTESCAKKYIFTLEAECTAEYKSSMDLTAAYKVTVFARVNPLNIMPIEYQASQPIIVETNSSWAAIDMRDWLLNGVPESQEYFVYMEDDATDPNIPHPLLHGWASAPAAQDEILKALTQTNTVWSVRQKNQPAQFDALWVQIKAAGFSSVSETTHQPGNFAITRYERTVP